MKLNWPTAVVLAVCAAGYFLLTYAGKTPQWMADSAAVGGMAVLAWLRSLRAPSVSDGKTPPETPAAKVQS